MYQVKCDDNTIYDLRDEDLIIISPKLQTELNKTGTFDFIIPPQNPYYSNIKKLKSIITIYQDGEEIWRGRVLNDKIDFYNRKQVECEGELSFLLDSIQRPYTFQGSPNDLFRQFITTHNLQVEDNKKFQIRNVDVPDNNNYINRSNSNHSNTWEAVNDKLIDTNGGYLESGPLQNGNRYIDYISAYTHINSQIIQFGENLLDITQYTKGENIKTAIIPLGAKNEETETRLTIESVNDGKDYIYDATAVALFGWIWDKVEYDDVTVASNLLTKGQNYLSSVINESITIELSAVDLHHLNCDIEKFKKGDLVRVISIPHRLDRYFVVSKLSISLDNPKSSVLTLGQTFSTLTKRQIEAEKQNTNNIQNVKEIAGEALATSRNADSKAIAADTSVALISYKVDYSYIYDEIQTYSFFYQGTSTHYWITKVPYRDSNNNVIPIKRGFANDVISENTLADETPRNFAKRKNATLCVNASIFGIDSSYANYKHILGPLIHNGVLISEYNTDGYVNTSQMGILAFDNSRNFKVFPITTHAEDILDEGFTETIIAFDQLITNGEITSNHVSANYLYNWNILAQNTTTKDLFFCECNGNNINGEQGMTIPTLLNILINDYNCDFAYRLDQGGSVALVKNKIMLNQPTDDSGTTERKVPDYIYFSKDLRNYNDFSNSDIYEKLSDLDIYVKKLNLSN